MSVEIQGALSNVREALWAEYDEVSGHWHGALSSSALSTAVVTFALSRVDPERHDGLIRRGLEWIASHQNDDGGWGDTVDSPTNITATILCWSALTEADKGGERFARSDEAAGAWLRRACGSLHREELLRAVVSYYGDDRTFSTPILMMCALAGRLGPEEEAWPRIVQLPFEMAVFPPGVFRFLKLMVVSYALPALIAIGLVRHRKCPSRIAPLRWLRDWVTHRVLAIAEGMQPSNGGYEEATPLTAFVTMALVAAGEGDSPIVRRAVEFLRATVQEDGSWPIDTSLATWVTVLAVTALTDGNRSPATAPPKGGLPASATGDRQVKGKPGGSLTADRRKAIRSWLLDQQHDDVHPLTSEGLGGWAWSDLPGAMPDADDTAGVLVALRRLGDADADAVGAAERGIAWLLSIQNGDGGIPTFCRGWGKLPFDRSCPDITAHAMRAFVEWRGDVHPKLRHRMTRALERCVTYLRSAQRDDGAWVPLWFGNQQAPGLENPTYGTAQVVIALRAIRDTGAGLSIDPTLERRGAEWLVSAQRADGGWGGHPGAPPTTEETALAVRALTGTEYGEAAARGTWWLIAHTVGATSFSASPIGLYFAKLWYSERLYPVVFTTWALEAMVQGSRGPRPA